jgi:hypothetical protein
MMNMQGVFQDIFTNGGAPTGAPLFSDRTVDVAEHFFHFSPDAAQIAMPLILQYRGVEADPPFLSDLVRMCVGHSGAREALLPKKPSD